MHRPLLAAPEPFPGPRHALADDDTPSSSVFFFTALRPFLDVGRVLICMERPFAFLEPTWNICLTRSN